MHAAFSDVQNTDILGLAHAFLLKVQKNLASIARAEENTSSNGTTSSGLSDGSKNTDEDTKDATRTNSSDYVSARNLLRPSLELFDRAVEAAETQGGASGKLFALVRI